MRLSYLFLALVVLVRVNGWSYQFLSAIMKPIGPLLGIQELVWFISQELRTEHMEHIDRFMIIIDNIMKVTQTVVTNNTEMRMITAPAFRNQMSVVFTTGAEDPIMKVYNKVVIGRHYYFAIVILVKKINVADMQPIHDLCRFNYNYQFFNSLIHFQSTEGISQIYVAQKYPTLSCDNRTDINAFFQEKYKQIENSGIGVEGFKFATPLRQDLPHLFKYRDRRNVLHYEGTTYRIIETFVKHIQGSFKELPLPSDSTTNEHVNMKEVLQLVRDRKIEFSAHAYALFSIDEELDKTYPLLVVKWCLMVPLYNNVSPYFYALQPFDITVWIFALGALVSMVLVELLWIWLFGTGRLHEAFEFPFCYIINIAAPRLIQRPSLLRFLLNAMIFFHGFFLCANYTSTLGSLLTVNLFHAQLNTMQDLVNAQLPVMIIDYELEFLLAENNELPADFSKLLLPVDSFTFSQHQTKFNSSYAYFVTEDHWDFLNEQQKHMKQRLFKFSDICFGSYHLAFPIQMDSYHWRDLEYYTYRVHSSGLFKYYERDSFENAMHAKFVERFHEQTEYSSAGMEHLAIAFIYLLVWSILASLVFAFELFWARSKRGS